MTARTPGEEPQLHPHGPHWESHHDVLLARAVRLTGDVHDAKDLVQETYLRAMTCRASFMPGTNVGAWLNTIMRRLFIDQWRRRQRATPVELSEVEHLLPVPLEEVDPGWSHVSTAQIDAAIDGLAPAFRSVFQLHAVERRSYREIAASLGIPAATVGTRLARARQKLKRVLQAG